MNQLSNINPFQAYGNVAAPRVIGQHLKFARGTYEYGANATPLATGTALVAVMRTLELAWVRWGGAKPLERVCGLVADSYIPPQRRDLGHEDSALWERTPDGSLKDPWTFSNRVVLLRQDDRSVFSFETSSRGGLDALGKLCQAYGAADPATYPEIELGSDSYLHKTPGVGRVKLPLLRVIGFVPAREIDEALGLTARPALSAPTSAPRIAGKTTFESGKANTADPSDSLDDLDF